MPVEIRPTGEPALYAAAGQAIRRGREAEKEEQLAFQREQALLDIAERRRAEQASRDWELQKMMLNSQQDFAHEQRLRQTQLEAEARSKEWEVEKMEIRSRMDFQEEEKERTKKIAAINNSLTSLDKAEKSGKYEPGLINSLRLDYQLQLQSAKGVSVPSIPFKQEDALTKKLREMQEGVGEKVITTVAPEMHTQAAAQGKSFVKNKATGEIVKVPTSDVAKRVASQQFEFVSPTVSPVAPAGHLAATQKEFEAIGKALVPPGREVSPIAKERAARLQGRRFGFYF